MSLETLLQQLGYEGSPCFLKRGDNRFETELGYGHIFRRATDPTNPKAPRWRAEGVYGIRESADQSGQFIPVVYVCSAQDAAAAAELHRLLWNQNVAPYVIVHSTDGIRVYSGFCYDKGAKTPQAQGIIHALTAFNQAQEIIKLFHRKYVDEGRLWHEPQLRIDPSKRLHHKLLATLRQLDKNLQKGGLLKEVSHALIGKYVYLRYLRDRDILSDDRLSKWGLDAQNIFGPKAQKNSLSSLSDKLDDWLNGEIFPVPWRGETAPSAEQVRHVAGAFAGEERTATSTQQHLDFQAYDFSFIPIETLSLVYEQFLHIEDDSGGTEGKKKAEGRLEGAYYTPLPLVNFMLAELERQHPLEKGMKIFDPSCGSGTFLVQAYRLLIEKTYPVTKSKPKPKELRDLLEESIFGCDIDGDACQVTQLSLLLTLLDYVDPPDLTGPMHSFKLPTLCETTNEKKLAAGHTPNILRRNFFGIEPVLAEAVVRKQGAKADWKTQGFDWIVGNPPWKTIRPKKLGPHDKPVWEWMKTHKKEQPVGQNQAAQAFAWQAPLYLKSDGECALLVPAMGLFEEPSEKFRKSFFTTYNVHTVSNFANLAEVLFEGRARVPAAAIGYRLRPTEEMAAADDFITVFSPFVVNQETTRPQAEGERGKIWSLVINGSEIRMLEQEEVAGGSGLPWKLAMWGSAWDERLLKRLEKKWPLLSKLEAAWDPVEKQFVCHNARQILGISQGLELRTAPEEPDDPAIEFDWKLGWKELDTDQLDRLRHLYAFPTSTTPALERRTWYGRGGRAALPLAVCKPPHIILSAARTFAVYSEVHLIVPPRQIGIISCTEDKRFLKALSLFLSSDFAFYHQFFRSTQLGVQRGRATLKSLRQMPIPLVDLSTNQLQAWVELHSKMVKQPPRLLEDKRKQGADVQGNLFEQSSDSVVDDPLKQLNDLTAEALGLTSEERALIHDLVHVRYTLTDGKRGEAAMRAPSTDELYAYARALKTELDDFVGGDSPRQHRVAIVADDKSATVEIDFTIDRKAARSPAILAGNRAEAKALRETRDSLLDDKHAHQWSYFNRNLRIYQGRKTYIFKPLNFFHWTVSAALTDGAQIIAETLGGS